MTTMDDAEVLALAIALREEYFKGMADGDGYALDDFGPWDTAGKHAKKGWLAVARMVIGRDHG